MPAERIPVTGRLGLTLPGTKVLAAQAALPAAKIPAAKAGEVPLLQEAKVLQSPGRGRAAQMLHLQPAERIPAINLPAAKQAAEKLPAVKRAGRKTKAARLPATLAAHQPEQAHPQEPALFLPGGTNPAHPPPQLLRVHPRMRAAGKDWASAWTARRTASALPSGTCSSGRTVQNCCRRNSTGSTPLQLRSRKCPVPSSLWKDTPPPPVIPKESGGFRRSVRWQLHGHWCSAASRRNSLSAGEAAAQNLLRTTARRKARQKTAAWKSPSSNRTRPRHLHGGDFLMHPGDSPVHAAASFFSFLSVESILHCQ